MTSSSLYFRARLAALPFEQKTGLTDLDYVSRAVLDYIGRCQAVGGLISITDVVKGSQAGTPPTVYARLSELQDLGWIIQEQNPHDGRSKIVRLSGKSRTVFGEIGRRMAEEMRKA
ncbi:MAG: MarR family winged helix-turn-helix transcriptional regulator [Armatimonadia bacterium]